MTTSFSAISDRLGDLAIEVPSWAYGNSGTRFKVFGSAGTPRTVEEKIDALIESKKSLSNEVLAGSDEINLTEMKDDDLLRLVALDLNAAMKD